MIAAHTDPKYKKTTMADRVRWSKNLKMGKFTMVNSRKKI